MKLTKIRDVAGRPEPKPKAKVKNESAKKKWDGDVTIQGKQFGEMFKKSYAVQVRASTIVGATGKAARDAAKKLQADLPKKKKVVEITVCVFPADE